MHHIHTRVFIPACLICVFNLLFIGDSWAQSCPDCDYYIDANIKTIDNAVLGYPPGSVICIQAVPGGRDFLNIMNFRSDPAAEAPFVFRNCGGQVVVHSTHSAYAIRTVNCKNIRITGTGDANFIYGIKIEGKDNPNYDPAAQIDKYSPQTGLSIGDTSTNCEVDHVEIYRTDLGMKVKTDPVCGRPETYRENFRMEDVRIHDNYIHENGNEEGLYIGYSFHQDGRFCVTPGTTDTFRIYPHDIIDLKLYNNRLYDIGSDGIQVGCATAGCEIHNNVVELYGQRPVFGAPVQAQGIQIGGGTTGLCYNNFVKAGDSIQGRTGIYVSGLGDNYVYNNVIIHSGENGIFIDEPRVDPRTSHIPNGPYYIPVFTGPGSGYRIVNNTIIRPSLECIKTYAELVEKNYFINNILIQEAGKYLSRTGGSGLPAWDTLTNVYGINILPFAFADPYYRNDNYRLSPNTPADVRDGGTDITNASYNWAFMNSDQDGNKRFYGQGFSKGAFEYVDFQSIRTGFLTPAVFCAGQPVQISYTVSDSFNTGNMFRAQLSGPTGKFNAEARDISLSVAASGSGMLTAVIPADILPGAGYRIRIMGTSPATAGSDNGYDIPDQLSLPADTGACGIFSGGASRVALAHVYTGSSCAPPDSGLTIVTDRASLALVSGQYITLAPGFRAATGARFVAAIKDPCVAGTKIGRPAEGGIIGIQGMEDDQRLNFSIFPNPCTGRFTVKLNSDSVAEGPAVWIYDAMGTLISDAVKGTGKSFMVDLTGNAEGIFFIKVKYGRELYTQKILLIHN